MRPLDDDRAFRPTGRRWSAVRGTLALVLVLSLACEKRTTPPPPSDGVWERDIAPLVTIEGRVTDIETGEPIAGAEVRVVDGPMTTTGSDGRFVLQTEPGRKQLELRANGFLLSSREVAAGETQFRSSIKVVRAGASQPIGAAGGTVAQGDTSLEIPPGAFPDGSSVSLTALPRGQASVVSAPVQFIDDSGVPRRVVGVVVLEASQDPALPLRVKTPVPEDATADSVVLHKIADGGEWTTPVAPMAILDGTAIFPVEASGQYGVSMDARRSDGARIGYVVTDNGDSPTPPGTVLLAGAPILTGQDPLTVVDPRGATIEIGPSSQIVLQEPVSGGSPIGVPDAGIPPADAPPMADAGAASDGPPADTAPQPDAATQVDSAPPVDADPDPDLAPYAGRVTVTAGRGRVTVRRPRAGSSSALGRAILHRPIGLVINVHTVTIRVRDGAFNLQVCNTKNQNITDLQVVQGSIEVLSGGDTLTIEAGQGRSFCPGCGGTEAPVCLGQAQAVPRARLDVAPLQVLFDEREVDSMSPPQTFTFKNLGDAPTGAITVQLEGLLYGQFDITSNTCTGQDLAPDATCTVEVAFRPKRPGLTEVSLAASGQAGGSARGQLTGMGRALTVLSLSPGALSFADQQVGTAAAPRALILSNRGGAPAGPLKIELAGSAPGAFRIASSSCPTVLAASASCSVAILFAPTAAGQAEAQLQVGDGRRTVSADLEGKGLAAPQLTASPTRLSFPDQALNTASPPQTVTFTNAGDLPTGALQVAVGGSATNFVFDGAGCDNRVLQPKMSCTVTVAFRPTGSGQALASVEATGTPGDTASAGLGGRALEPARLGVSPAQVTFADQVKASSSAVQNVTFTNQGEVATEALTAALTGPGSAQFLLDAADCAGRRLAPGSSCTAQVTFHPLVRGPAAASVRMTAAGGVAAAAGLAGVGLDPAQLTVSAPLVRFPNRVRDISSPPESLTFTNSGDVATGPLVVALTGAGAAAYALDGTGCADLALPPRMSCSVSVTFRPTARGETSASVQVSGAPGGAVSTGLTGRGLDPARLLVSSAEVAFGDRVLNTISGPETILFTNAGDVVTGPLIAGITGAGAAQFVLDGSGCAGVALGPGTSCAIRVSFRPVLAGAALATLGVTGGPEDAPIVPLGGRGLLPARLVVTGAPTAFANREAGTPSDPETLTVTNEGDVPAGPLVLQISSTPAGSFHLDAGGCAGTILAPHTSCTVGLAFQPTEAGDVTGLLTVAGPPSDAATTPLAGKGLVPPRLVADTATLAFTDRVLATQSESRSVTFTNEGEVATEPLAVGVGGTNPGQFRVVTDSCTGATLPPEAACAIGVAFAPLVGGPASATLLILGAAGGADRPTLSGRGLTPAALVATPAAVPFGGHLHNSSSEVRAITFTNTGDVPTGPLSAAALAGASSGQFEIRVDRCALAVLQPAGTCIVGVAFEPTVLGALDATVGLSGSPGGSASATLTGQGLSSVDLISSQDVGAVALPGSWTQTAGTHTLQAAGADIGGTADALRFAYRAISGDVTITARISSLLDTSARAKAGVMVREDLTAGARNVATLVTPAAWNLFRQQVRASTGGSTSEGTSAEASALPAWLRLQRAGSTFTSYYSLDGTSWIQIGTPVTVSMNAAVFVGLATTSHNTAGHTSATFTDVSIGVTP